jgi:hypothetical protein
MMTSLSKINRTNRDKLKKSYSAENRTLPVISSLRIVLTDWHLANKLVAGLHRADPSTSLDKIKFYFCLGKNKFSSCG